MGVGTSAITDWNDMNIQIQLHCTLLLFACGISSNLTAKPHLREPDHLQEEEQLLKLAQQASDPAAGSQVLEKYSTWELGTFLQNMQKLAAERHDYADRGRKNQALWEAQFEAGNVKSFFSTAFLLGQGIPTELKSIISLLDFNPDWNLQIPEKLRQQLENATVDDSYQISAALCAIFINSANEFFKKHEKPLFTQEEENLLQTALQNKLGAMLAEKTRDMQEHQTIETITDNPNHIKALDTTITRIKELRKKRFTKLFKQFCCVCVAFGVFHYRKQLWNYLVTKQVWRHGLKIHA